jgi:hypothetical protein
MGMRLRGAGWTAVALAMSLCASAARAAQVCGWMLEKTDADNMHELEIWLDADQEISFFYKIGGQGLVDESGHANSPNSGTFVLHPGEPGRPWGFGMTLQPPGQVDVVIEIHQTPKDIFSDEETPLLTSFTFHRDVPADETQPPADLAKRQCATVAAE